MVTQALAVKYPQDVRALVIASCPIAQTPESAQSLLQRGADAQRDGIAQHSRRHDAALVQRRRSSTRGGDAAVRARLLTDRRARLGRRLERDGDHRYRAAPEARSRCRRCALSASSTSRAAAGRQGDRRRDPGRALRRDPRRRRTCRSSSCRRRRRGSSASSCAQPRLSQGRGEKKIERRPHAKYIDRPHASTGGTEPHSFSISTRILPLSMRFTPST